MKKMLLVISMMVGFIFTSSFGADNSLEKVKNSGELVVGLDDTFAPMGFKDEKGNVVGFDIDLANEVANRMGVKAVFKPCDWDGIIFELRSGNIDVVWNGMTVTEDRKKQILFSDPYLQDGQIVIVKENSPINSIADLKDKNIGVQLGSTAYFAIEKTPTFKELKDIKKYSNNVEALLDLEAGRTDAVVMDSVVGKYYTAKKGGFKILNEDFGAEDMAVGLRKNDVALKNEIDKNLVDMKKDGTYNKISEKWFGKEGTTQNGK